MTMLDSEGRIKPLVDRLRQAAQEGREIIEPWDHDPHLYDEAADEIARLTDAGIIEEMRGNNFHLLHQIDQLRAALEECAKASYLDEYELKYRPTREALIAQKALGH